MDDLSQHYTTLKPFLFAVAYNMTGEVQEAEDLVQDAFEDVLKRQQTEVKSAKSYLTRIVMNKAIDRLGRLKKQREEYPALWLPEPFITETEAGENRDILSYAFLHLMDELNPLERAVFILREAFDHPYEEIATICDATVDNCRQILHRAKTKLRDPKSLKPAVNAERNQKVLQEFLKACLSEDTTALSVLLKDDVLLYSDGGGKVVAARRILEGISGVSKFLLGIARKTFEKWSSANRITVNGEPALIMPDENGIYMVLIPFLEDGKVVKLFLMRNPDKIFLGRGDKSPSKM